MTQVKLLKGVGDKTAPLLQKMGISTIWDLLTYYPRDYESCGRVAEVSDAYEYEKNNEPIVLRLKLKTQPVLRFFSRTKVLSVIAGDDSGSIELVWFNQPYLKNQLKTGDVSLYRGSLKRKGASLQLVNPKRISDVDYEKMSAAMMPVYPTTKGVTAAFIQKLVHQALTELPPYPDYLKAELSKGGFLENQGFMEMNEAIRNMHFPQTMDNVVAARRRLVFDEFLMFLMNVRAMKEESVRLKNQCVIKPCKRADEILANLPYKLTNAQLRTLEEIKRDMQGEFSMNRLIQGDVGSGKTIVAFLSLITAAENGYQSAMMAPTEVLARQHYEAMTAMLKENNITDIKCVLLIGSMTAKQKREAKAVLSEANNAIAIGTHALIQEDVYFNRLGLVITDEQHRFGVKQRMRLSGQDREGNQLFSSSPHTLVMSATPIPRTLAIIVYGDLDISLIDELPAERLPIKNCVVGPGWRPNAYRFIEGQIKEGRQALVVCPMVEESEQLEAENVIDYTKRLKDELPSDITIEYLHGRMKPKEKDEIMARFAGGETKLLVSTTVIEVGINVPNTTVMMVENAERFGLAQLHQLRGRVGRGKHQSYCIFMCSSDKSDSKKKLDILSQTNDGFKIAEEDLKQRGPGDMFGFRQSGDMAFKIGDIYTDSRTLKLASDYAQHVYEDDFINNEKYTLLRQRLNQYSHEQVEKINL